MGVLIILIVALIVFTNVPLWPTVGIFAACYVVGHVLGSLVA